MYHRFVERRVREALADTRVVMLCGPRQAGKTTLVQRIAGDDIPFYTLDDEITLDAASNDPIGFVRSLDRAVIDEIQRVPRLLLAIKTSVDTDPRPGRFLLTGSANLMTLPLVTDSLAGRMEIIRLLPLAQAELRGTRPSFLERVFAADAPAATAPAVGSDLMEIVLAGGYPEALTRTGWRRRRAWHVNYVEAILQRDVRDIARIEQLKSMPKLLRVLAEHSGRLVNYSSFGSPLGMSHVTIRKYVGVLEDLFLIQTIQPWYSNVLKRLLKSPKLHFLDAGLLASLRRLTPDRVRRERTAFGPLLESFVFGELLKLASWADDPYSFSHFRDKEGNEVDIVLEDASGRVAGIEVKASATVSSRDFAGLKRLAAACGDNFAQGLVLHDHDRTIPFGHRLASAPIATLWS